MIDIRSTFVDDIFRWILIKCIRLNPNGAGVLIQHEDQTYFTSQDEICAYLQQIA